VNLYQAQIIGHGTEEDGVRKLNKKTGKTIAEELKPASHVPILGTILNIFDVFNCSLN
jgi:hypothetical protein